MNLREEYAVQIVAKIRYTMDFNVFVDLVTT